MNTEAMMRASVLIPTRNGMPLLESCLRAVLAQDTPWPFEVIAIDSGSGDGTWPLLQSLPITALRIAPREFNHGATRNLAAAKAQGEYLVFLVQDAVPADTAWLRRLVEGAALPGAAASYGRQLVWPTHDRLVHLHVREALPQPRQRAQQRLPDGPSWDSLAPRERLELSRFSNVSSCISRRIWEQHPFNPEPYGEDIEWAQRIIRLGYTIVYEPAAAVYHSHDRSSWYEFKRAYADHELVARLFGYRLFPQLRNLAAAWAKGSARGIMAIWNGSESLPWRTIQSLRAPVVIGARHLGSCLGARAGLARRHGTLWRCVDQTLRRGV